MIVTIHQPNLYPWLGFFDKMLQADLFISLDNVPFTKRGFQNRVQLKGAGGPQWLTLPVSSKGKYGQITGEVEISDEQPWSKSHLKTLELCYKATPYFPAVYPQIEEIYRNWSGTSMVEFNLLGISLIKELLGIETGIVSAQALGIQGTSSELLSDLVYAVGGTVYLSGPSGRQYLDETVFEKKGIRVAYHRFDSFTYPQRFGEFAGGLSALDYLFNAADVPLSERRRRVTA